LDKIKKIAKKKPRKKKQSSDWQFSLYTTISNHKYELCWI
jgi:hypothetical protein